MVKKSSKKSSSAFDCASRSPSYKTPTSKTSTKSIFPISKPEAGDPLSLAAGSESISPLNNIPVPLQQQLGLRTRHAPILPRRNMTFAMNSSSTKQTNFSTFHNSGIPSPPQILPAATPATFLGTINLSPSALNLENQRDAYEEIETDSSAEQLTLKPTTSQFTVLLPEQARTPETILANPPERSNSPSLLKSQYSSSWDSKRPSSAGEGPSGRIYSPIVLSTSINSAPLEQPPLQSRHSRNTSVESTMSFVSNCTYNSSKETQCNSCASSSGSAALAITTAAASPKTGTRARRNANVGLVPVTFGRSKGIISPDMPPSPPRGPTAAVSPGSQFLSPILSSTAPPLSPYTRHHRQQQLTPSPCYLLVQPPSPSEPLLSRPPTSLGSAPFWPRYGNDDNMEGAFDFFFGSEAGINWEVLVSTRRGKRYLALGICLFLIAVAATTVTWGLRDLITETLNPTEVVSIGLGILGFDIVCALAGYRVLACAHKLVR